MPVTSIIPVLSVADMARAEAFYVGALGFKVVDRTRGEGSHSECRLVSGSAVLSLVRDEVTAGGPMLGLGIDDIIEGWFAIRHAGYLPRPLELVGGALTAEIDDPDGYQIRLWQMISDVNMTGERLVNLIRQTHAEFEGVLEEAGEHRFDEPGVQGHWSIKGILAHLAWWENRMITLIDSAISGTEPEMVDWKQIDRINDDTWKKSRERPIADVRAVYEETHRRMLDKVRSLSDEQLMSTDIAEWLGDDPLWLIVGFNSFDHYPRHGARISKWLGNRR